MTLKEEIDHFLRTFADKFERVNGSTPDLMDIMAQQSRIFISAISRLEDRVAAFEARIDPTIVSRVETTEGNVANIGNWANEVNKRLSNTKDIPARVETLEKQIDLAIKRVKIQ